MTPSETSWGWHGRHYAEQPGRNAGLWPPPPKRAPGPTPTEKRWAELLEQATPGAKDQVTRAFKQWNNILRDYLRTETALRLTVGDDAQAVPVRVVDGMPAPFAEAVRQFEGLEWLLLNRPMVEAAAKGVGFLEQHRGAALDLLARQKPPIDGAPTAAQVADVQKLAEDLLRVLDKAGAVQRIAGINEDVLGAYFFRVPEIRLYWIVIGIVAAAISVQPEALAIVVLAHELAHAYTHLGRDIDSERWETEAFASADLGIVEGLAQFYTATICKRIQTRMPAAWTAYEALLKVQSGPYLAHQGWVDKDETGGEIVRVAMIECRLRGLTKISDFAAPSPTTASRCADGRRKRRQRSR